MADGLTLAEWAEVLDPPVTEPQLRALVAALNLRSDGVRHTGRPGAPCKTYPLAEVMKVHSFAVPYLVEMP